MKVIYVAGRFRADTHWGIVQNVRAAEAVALDVCRAGGVALCPHLNTANFQGALPDEFWLDATMELLRRCDAVMMVPGWPDSKGALAERDEAKRNNMPVFDAGDYGGLERWLAGKA